jgi:hypothetical protein
MAIVTWYVGLDYHQAKLQVCVIVIGRFKQYHRWALQTGPF